MERFDDTAVISPAVEIRVRAELSRVDFRRVQERSLGDEDVVLPFETIVRERDEMSSR